MAPTRADLLATVDRFFDAYKAFSLDAILSVRSPTCIHRTGPKSHGNMNLNNAQFREFMAPMLGIFRNFKLFVADDDETMVDVEKRKVFLHLQCHAETDAGPYENDYHWILTMNETGDLIDDIVEWVDSAYLKDFLARLESTKPAEARS
ncbi:hypothetical protein PV08_06413 [Exophiala spinifera]|uniref:SnoaL-like domain-containing protein n=1 Tax=Exophiala spinifera TaxID=91928 RepID=A0A0D1ZUA0_9EURO|nr:uncharacterized protein PV08_06413 [Exophiala spinifera]KIW16362.1 hypothetical protein PV08_06413 [Exophiala spinifera]